MLHDGRAIRVAVVGSSRIPFSRSHSIYRNHSNKDLMTAALEGVVNKYDLRGQVLGDVALGAVIKHARDWASGRKSADEGRMNRLYAIESSFTLENNGEALRLEKPNPTAMQPDRSLGDGEPYTLTVV